MKDYLGNELNVGDKVVYVIHRRASSKLHIGYIRKLNPVTAFIVDNINDKGISTRKSYDKIVKVG